MGDCLKPEARLAKELVALGVLLGRILVGGSGAASAVPRIFVGMVWVFGMLWVCEPGGWVWI